VLNLLKDGEQIAFTLEIEHKTKCRLIEGLFYKRPGKAGEDELKRDQDCFIIDSLVDYFETPEEGKLDDKIVLFGTKDGGFGPFKNEPEMIGKTGMIDTLFQDGLPPTKLFTNLEDLVKFIRKKGTIDLLAEPPAKQEPEETEEVQQAEESVEAVISVPSGGRVIEVVVRDHIPISDSAGASTTTTLPPMGWMQGMDSQNRANQIAMLRRMDDQRRRRNAESHVVPPSFFAPPPNTKAARIGLGEKSHFDSQHLRRWTDPAGVAWRVEFSIGGDLYGLITLDRSKADESIGDVSEECDRFLRTLRFSYQRITPPRRLGGAYLGGHLEEVLDPEPILPHDEPPYAEPPYAEPPYAEPPYAEPPHDEGPPMDEVPHDEGPPS
jgi:hypothetical protein